MWAGLVGQRRASTAVGVTLPAYIGAMLVAAVIRNVDDATGVIGLSQRTIDDLGSVALSLFLVLALMTLRLWELAGLALPMVVILAAQVALIAAVCWPVFRMMGRDYDAAVMSGGLCGFMLGHDGQRDGQHGGAGRPLRSGAAGLSRRADGRRLLHRLHQRGASSPSA